MPNSSEFQECDSWRIYARVSQVRGVVQRGWKQWNRRRIGMSLNSPLPGYDVHTSRSGWRLMILARKSQNSPITYPLLGGAPGWVYPGANGRKPTPPVGRLSQEGILARKFNFLKHHG
ncbi:MAG: hypothetical protein QNJ46_28750 [Leptolyngbyaceae cyanobacterium MO_188.B28]|nr:hypothetical protein [Leptolyngbyaceae cyanobacterium MO_188.B28]